MEEAPDVVDNVSTSMGTVTRSGSMRDKMVWCESRAMSPADWELLVMLRPDRDLALDGAWHGCSIGCDSGVQCFVFNHDLSGLLKYLVAFHWTKGSVLLSTGGSLLGRGLSQRLDCLCVQIHISSHLSFLFPGLQAGSA